MTNRSTPIRRLHRTRSPTQVMGAAVLSYIEAGLLIVCALFLLLGAAIVDRICADDSQNLSR